MNVNIKNNCRNSSNRYDSNNTPICVMCFLLYLFVCFWQSSVNIPYCIITNNKI
nr:MAG TPA: hypothetical protein [Bacteriophage sp.]